MSLFFGSQLNGVNATFDEVRRVAQEMDRGHWHSAWTFDHFVPPMPGFDERGGCLEGWTLLTGLAVTTERLRWGCLVTGNTYRNPALLAKMAATVDEITGGRLELGIGAAWHEREHEASGWEFPPLRERSDRLEEACALIRALFTATEPVDFEGKYYRLVNAPFAPRCVQQPHVPIMVGGGGEKRTLRTLARYGDVMNVSGTPDVLRHKIEVVQRHCANAGRDPSEITSTVFMGVYLSDDEERVKRLRGMFGAGMTEEEQARYVAVGNAEHIINVFREYEAAGADGIILQAIPNKPDLYARLNEEVLPAFV
jgi:F420-dependent oxidoreductase-like protein